MSYMALYRKFRPTNFEDVKGQEHIVTTLKNQIKTGRIGHAYLFCGTRGTGKTTIAKILAKVVNCEDPIDGNPCNRCKICHSITDQVSMNVIEIDAASNNGVDNIREIIEEVQYSPTEGLYKVYIIDEVHMLSTGAFNALLKTLEEPPSYVIFILATTEVHKIPITILSRCQRYDFKRITIDTIVERLKELMEKENLEAEEKAIRYIAKAADGSMRDALSLLDQCNSFYLGQKLTYDKVLEILGTVDIEVFSQLLKFIQNKEIIKCIELIEKIIIAGKELNQFIIDFIWYLRNILLIKTSDYGWDKVDVSSENLEILKMQAEEIDIDTIIYYIQNFSELSNQIKYAMQKRVLVEIALIKLCKPQMETDYQSIVERIKQIEEQLERGFITRPIEDQKEVLEDQKEIVIPNAVPEDLKQVTEKWKDIIKKLSPVLRTLISSAKLSIGEENSLLLVFTEEMDRNFVEQEAHLQEIQEAIEKQIEKKVVVKTKLISLEQEKIEQEIDLTKIIKMEIKYEE